MGNIKQYVLDKKEDKRFDSKWALMDKLNELAEENEVCKEAYNEIKSDAIHLKEENEQLKLLIKKVLETTPIEHSLALDLKNSIMELYK